jgi:hypothetical protein
MSPSSGPPSWWTVFDPGLAQAAHLGATLVALMTGQPLPPPWRSRPPCSPRPAGRPRPAPGRHRRCRRRRRERRPLPLPPAEESDPAMCPSSPSSGHPGTVLLGLLVLAVLIGVCPAGAQALYWLVSGWLALRVAGHFAAALDRLPPGDRRN